jgi:Spy/CpxP family protein refolding chaperone
MKKLIMIGLIVGGIACTSFASFASDEYANHSDWNQKTDWQHGQSRFVEQLNLDPERAAQMEEILSSYREVPKLYFTGQTDKIPAFLAEKDAELEALLTPEELAQFKQAFAEWAKKKNFKFMKFSSYQLQPQTQPTQFDVPADLREEIRQTMDSHLIEIGKQLHNPGMNA